MYPLEIVQSFLGNSELIDNYPCVLSVGWLEHYCSFDMFSIVLKLLLSLFGLI